MVVDARPCEPFEEQVLQLAAHVGVEAIARQRHEQRDAPPVQIAADEEPDVLLLLQGKESHHLGSQLVDGGGEQLVLRERLEDRDDRLVVVRSLDEVFGFQDLVQLAVEHGGLRGRLHVRLRREQTDHARLARDATLG